MKSLVIRAAFRSACLFACFTIGAQLAHSQSVPFSVYFWYPTNGQAFTAPANIGVHAQVTDSNIVRAVQYFNGNSSIGLVSNAAGILLTNSKQDSPFYMLWSNVPAGTYTLTAVATDSAGIVAASPPVSVTVTNQPPPVVPFTVGFWYPTNSQTFAGPTNIGVHAKVTDSNVVRTVQYFAGSTSIGIVSNLSGVLLTNSTQANPFEMSWSNVAVGTYSLTAVATDSAGTTATSAPVTITVTNVPPPVVRPAVYIYSPTNGAMFYVPTNVALYARAVESSGQVATVQFFANSTSLGIVSSSSQAVFTNVSQEPLFRLLWSNVAAGAYAITAVATDTNGNTATSSVVNISVTAPPPPPKTPFSVGFYYPTNGQTFAAPATIGVHAEVTDSNVVPTVQYFANGTRIGIVSNVSGVLLTNSTQGNPFFMSWSNVLAGNYSLTAVATDSAGNTATSAPVTIFVISNLPVVTIYATDPVAVQGANAYPAYAPPTSVSNYVSGGNTATFLIRRDSGTNTALTVYYSIGGTATNGVDYQTIPNYATIQTGQRYALVTIVPLNNSGSASPAYKSVVLSLTLPTNSPPTYAIGSPQKAGTVIAAENLLPIPGILIHTLADNSVHTSLPATNGMNFCLEISSDLVNWQPICTNTVLKGSAQYVDPNGAAASGLYYRIVPAAAPPSY